MTSLLISTHGRSDGTGDHHRGEDGTEDCFRGVDETRDLKTEQSGS